ncbi:MAG: UDP-N-acetylglucosamine--N-acetylmuramyl-(pentapeptide) pyrophosphoryl-undecaprenol N-acetylglucosamine transferase [Clostridia bacterium]|nr:UDP-N-acetylglucosamine--N-acetylmuramyl-(pentapeptide) pyrophosphoryl-undecaprenol N-acetylglucosamine transferase [Clostridia bacterium]
MKRIAFTGGGSAGHTVPNVALIQTLLKTGETELCYFGSDGIEKSIIAPLKIPYYSLHPPKLKRGFSWEALKNNLAIPARLQRAIREAKEGLRAFRPDLVFSKGGFVALPVVHAAKSLGIPCLSHESDFSMGLANRLTAGKCEYVLTSFPETADTVKNGKYTGQPIREELFNYPRAQAKRELCEGTTRKVVLVFGGGSGSAAINSAVRQIAPILCKKYYLLHVCGKGNVIDTNLQHYRQTEFIADMGAAYAAADVIVSRAGAGAAFEILALKKPAIFIPLEGQTRGDQAENAAYFAQKGLCRVLKQSKIDGLLQSIVETLSDEGLKSALSLSQVHAGNENILHEIRSILAR